MLYRLNAAAKKAKIDYSRSSTARRLHVNKFLQKLSDANLRRSLQGNNYDGVEEVEDALRQIEEVERGVRDGPNREFDKPGRVNPTLGGPTRFTRFSNRPQEARSPTAKAYVGVEEESTGYRDPDNEEVPAAGPVPPDQVPDNGETWADVRYEIDGHVYTEEEIYRLAVDQQRRRGEPPQPSSAWPAQPVIAKAHASQPGDRAFGNSAPALFNPSRPPLGVCRKCGKTGHREETCWAELVCARCGIQGHPAQVCRRPPCEACGTFHERGKCELWRDMEELKKVIKAGGSLSDMPEALKARLLGSR
jgi:hypothetical protein